MVAKETTTHALQHTIRFPVMTVDSMVLLALFMFLMLPPLNLAESTGCLAL